MTVARPQFRLLGDCDVIRTTLQAVCVGARGALVGAYAAVTDCDCRVPTVVVGDERSLAIADDEWKAGSCIFRGSSSL